MSNYGLVEDMFVVITTEADLDRARKLAELLLRKKLVACVSIRQIESHYWWKNQIQESAEAQLFIKTKKGLVDKLTYYIEEYHSYDIPEILIWPVSANRSYMEWANETFLKPDN